MLLVALVLVLSDAEPQYTFSHPDMNAPPDLCNREKSRTVRNIVRQLVLNEVDSEFDLPDDCPLDPEQDMYLEHEEHKHTVLTNDWKCGYCGKHFKSESFLDKHLHRKHADTIDKERTVCLADLCDVFVCDNKYDQRGSDLLKPSCDQNAMKRMNHKCLALIHRCFPPEMSVESHRLSTLLGNRICSHFSCDYKGLSPMQALQEREEPSYQSRFLFVITIVFGFVFGVFACAMLLYYREITPSSDLQFLFGKRHRLSKVKGF
eukprot:c8669_g1_i2.p1 GENE.c8669_g1_i2~~c8669_g1_i2.p1  ORF type:complete len:262 (+),score=66.04 c8669_g1_i2:48-833(+)